MKKIVMFTAALILLSGAMACNKIPDKESNYHFLPQDTNPIDAAPVIDGTWQIDTVRPGLVWKHFSGRDIDVTGVTQNVNVLEMDMTNPRLHLKFHYGNGGGVKGDLSDDEVNRLTMNKGLVGGSDTKRATDEVFAYMRINEGAVACVNGAYEAGSVWIRAKGKYHALAGSTNIPDNIIPQWKSEACVVCDSEGQDIQILFPGYNEVTEKGTDAWEVAAQREFYRTKSSSWPNMFSSSPLLVYNGIKFGTTFVQRMKDSPDPPNYKRTTGISENPIPHQTNTHPRTAIALVEDNDAHAGCDKCLLITVDGRQAMGVGISAAHFTEFLMYHFPNIKYALNMDGGGSTCMCIIDRGNNANVVNHPIDDGVIDQVRTVNSHFYITYDEPEPDSGGGESE
ncbi:MAG: phosphodiester glycosidase family protein [Bacteroidales bacterium]|nr:phosphodiester glycosidase family protein [Bacteroidales bacterium]